MPLHAHDVVWTSCMPLCTLLTWILLTGMVFDAFPFPPYPIQQDFMEALYNVISEGGVGLFESPTGRLQDRLPFYLHLKQAPA